MPFNYGKEQVLFPIFFTYYRVRHQIYPNTHTVVGVGVGINDVTIQLVNAIQCSLVCYSAKTKKAKNSIDNYENTYESVNQAGEMIY